jgi:4-hydroxymandelate oxidase
VGTYDELHAQAKALLPAAAYAYFATGTGIEETLVANEVAWRQLGLRPRVLRDGELADLRGADRLSPPGAPRR